MQSECSGGAVTVGGFRETTGHVMGGRIMGDVEDISTAHDLVAIRVQGVQGIEVDLHVEVRGCECVGREIDDCREFVE